jgi:hypothetical protein
VIKSRKCRSCGKRKLRAAFYAAAGNSDRLMKDCKTCKNTYKQNRYRTEPGYKEAYLALKHRYLKTPVGRANEMLAHARTRAAKRGISFSLDRGWVENKLRNGLCEVTGLPFCLEAPRGSRVNPFSPSLDRKNQKGNYSKRNCRLVLTWYNMARNDFDDADVLKCARAFVDVNNIGDLNGLNQ